MMILWIRLKLMNKFLKKINKTKNIIKYMINLCLKIKNKLTYIKNMKNINKIKNKQTYSRRINL